MTLVKGAGHMVHHAALDEVVAAIDKVHSQVLLQSAPRRELARLDPQPSDASTA
jgi:hypothetical protein